MRKAKLRESQIRKQIIDYIKLKGIKYVYNLQGLGCYKGISDLTLFFKNGVTVWVEIKTETGKQSEYQRIFQKMLEETGNKYMIVRSLDDLIEQLEREGLI